MNVNVTCEKHNVSMKVIREYTLRGNIEVTVEPCYECIQEAANPTICQNCGGWLKGGECENCSSPIKYKETT